MTYGGCSQTRPLMLNSLLTHSLTRICDTNFALIVQFPSSQAARKDNSAHRLLAQCAIFGQVQTMTNLYDVPASHLLHSYLLTYFYVVLSDCEDLSLQHSHGKNVDKYFPFTESLNDLWPMGHLHAPYSFAHFSHSPYPPIKAVITKAKDTLLCSQIK